MSKTFDQTTMGKVHGVSMAASGCGCCAIASIVYNIDPSITPQSVADYMYRKGYWSSAGCTRTGVTNTLEHYGLKVTHYLKDEHRGGIDHEKFCSELKRSANEDVWGIFLAVGKSDGAKDNYWTYGGHFLSVTDYIKKNGVDQYYVRDSGAKHNTGYHQPDAFKRDVNVYYVITKKDNNPDKMTEEIAVKKLQESLNDAYNANLIVDGSCGNITEGVVNRHNIKYGNVNEFVGWVQWCLKLLGYDIEVDKSFGKITCNCVKEFQKSRGIAVDGVVGIITVRELLKAVIQ